MSRITSEIDRGTRLVASVEVRATELTRADRGTSFEDHRIDTGEDLTRDDCFDQMPTDKQIEKLPLPTSLVCLPRLRGGVPRRPLHRSRPRLRAGRRRRQPTAGPAGADPPASAAPQPTRRTWLASDRHTGVRVPHIVMCMMLLMHDGLGHLLEGARTRQALSQGALAAYLTVSQQTVSRWEKGQSRPRGAMIAKLAAALNLSVDDVTSAMDAPTEPQRPQAEDVPLPVRPLVPVLPLNSLSADNFERFVTELLQRRFPDAEVSQLGGQGDDQRGFDILMVHSDGRRGAVQCKREQQFGPKKLAKAIAAAELDVAEPIIALARAATADARFEMEKHAGWLLWDQADLSRQVRQLPPESALYLVRTYFPSHVEPFLGVSPASPWMAVDEFYRSTSFTLLNHRQPLVGREQTVEEIIAWAVDPYASNVAVLVGRRGLGKSKLLRDVATRPHASELHFRFLAVDQAPTPNDFDSLPRTGDLVVVVDDVHGVDGVAGIAAQLWMQRPRAKLLLATRPYGETMLDAEVWKLNQSPRALQRWTLEDLSQAEMCNLVSRLTDRSIFDPLTRQLASISADCPFVAVVAADLLDRGELSGTTLASDVALRADVLRRFADLATTHGSGRDAAERREVLAALAAFQPVRLSDRAFATAVTALTRIESWDIVNGRIRELEDAGLILRRGDAVRLVPDILGDILLGQAAYDDRSDRATAFLPRAQDAATGAPLEHLLVNLEFRRYAAGSSQARRMAWISVGVGCSGRAHRNLAAMRTRRSFASMSDVDGLVLVRYQGLRARCSATSEGWCPAVAYQQTARVRQASPNGTVRSTAAARRLWAWPTPTSCLASSMATSIAHRAA